MLKAALTGLLLLFCYAGALAQENKINPALPNPRVRERYDRFSDLSSVVVDIPIIEGVVDLGGGSVYVPPKVGRDLYLTVLGIIEGKDFTKSIPKVTIAISSRSENWMYLNGPNLLQVIVDGTHRATLGEMKRLDSDVDRRGRGVQERLILDVPFTAIERLANASRVEVRVGPDEFELKKKDLLNLKDWLAKFPAAKAQTTTH